MFIKITKRDFESLKNLSKSAILTYIQMKFYAGQNGECFPSRGTLADKTGLSIGSIKRALKELKENGIISIGTKRRTSSNQYILEGAKDEPEGVSSNLSGVQKKAVRGTNLTSKGFKDEPLIRTKELDTKLDTINKELCEKDLWLGELFAKHSVEQGWISDDVQKDFDYIKKDLSVLQIAKAVKRIDHWIVSRKMCGMYKGRGWAIKIRERWAKKETNVPITAFDKRSMSMSTIKLNTDLLKAFKNKEKESLENLKKSEAVVMADISEAHNLWAKFRGQSHSYQECAQAVKKWFLTGGCTDKIKNEIEKDKNLEDFQALIDLYETEITNKSLHN